VITIGMIVGGLFLMVVSYFGLSAPWGNQAERHSNPRIDFAASLFVLGVVLTFLSAVVYEVLPKRWGK
jgi:uncharacterized BrkB/YihY/UPF0761 family membrane protein